MKTLILLLVLVSCNSGGGGGSGSSNNVTPPVIIPPVVNQEEMTGYFIDSPVEGLKYQSYSGRSGQTNSVGEFKCLDNEQIKFFIGNMQLAVATCKKTTGGFLLTMDKLFAETTISNTSKSSAIAAFLLRLNSESLTNKIVIPSVVRNAIGFTVSINWDLSPAMYLDDLNAILTAAGKPTFIDVPEFNQSRLDSANHLLLMKELRLKKGSYKGFIKVPSIGVNNLNCLDEYLSVSINEFNQITGFDNLNILNNEENLPNIRSSDFSLTAIFDFNNNQIYGNITKNSCEGILDLRPVGTKFNASYSGYLTPFTGTSFNNNTYCMEGGQNIKMNFINNEIDISGSFEEEQDLSSTYIAISLNNGVSYPYYKQSFTLDGKQSTLYLNEFSPNLITISGLLVQKNEQGVSCLSTVELYQE